MLWDAHGRADTATRFALAHLRPHAEHLIVVSNGQLQPESREFLAAVADEVMERENTGFDVGAYRAALEHVGLTSPGFDEVLLTNYTWFGPIPPSPGDDTGFAPMFAAAERLDADAWGLTEHGPISPDPYRLRGTLPAHLQSHFIAVRRPVLDSDAWRAHWDDMPPVRSYADSVRFHEAALTPRLREAGFRVRALYPRPLRPGEHAPAANPAMERPLELLEFGCPVVKRRLAWHDPVELDHRGVVAAEVFGRMRALGYPDACIQDAVTGANPRVIATNLGWSATIPDGDADAGSTRVASPVLSSVLASAATVAATATATVDAAADEHEPLAFTVPPAAAAVNPATLTDALTAHPHAGVVIQLASGAGRDPLGEPAGDAAASRLADSLGFTGLDLDGTPPLGVGVIAGAVRRELAATLGERLVAAGGATAAANATGQSAQAIERALVRILAALAVTRGEAVIEADTASGWRYRATALATREAELRRHLPRGVRAPFRTAAARGVGGFTPRALADLIDRAAPGFTRAIRSLGRRGR